MYKTKEVKRTMSVFLTLDFSNANSMQLAQSKQFDLLAHHHIFDAKNILPKTMFQSESELFCITLIKDKIYQLYKTHIQHSNLVNNTNERLRNKDFIDPSANVNQDQIITGLVYTIGDFAKWLTRFAKEMPGLNKIIVSDFSTIISSSVLFLYAVHNHLFFYDDDIHTIISNNIQINRKRLEQIFGNYLANLLYTFHAKFDKLCLSENEIAIFYPFVLISCNRKFHDILK